MRKLTHHELLERQKNQNKSKLPFCAVLNNIRSLHNVGSIFRTADGVGIEKLWLCGITGIPPSNKISKTALGAEKEVPWEYRQDPCALLRELKSSGYTIVFLEQTLKSRPYQSFIPAADRPIALVLGNEISGVGDELLPLCEQAIEIEMSGFKNSLNVTVAFGIAAYHIRNHLSAKSHQQSF
ncbi:MAG: RNA methyltransferase [Candidatus Omnitrophica bacterium]|nr:RNA methyltransferase [Candidatus Omnitrophota bacterium]